MARPSLLILAAALVLIVGAGIVLLSKNPVGYPLLFGGSVALVALVSRLGKNSDEAERH